MNMPEIPILYFMTVFLQNQQFFEYFIKKRMDWLIIPVEVDAAFYNILPHPKPGRESAEEYSEPNDNLY